MHWLQAFNNRRDRLDVFKCFGASEEQRKEKDRSRTTVYPAAPPKTKKFSTLTLNARKTLQCSFIFLFNFAAPSGPPTNVEIVATNETSVKLTWTRPYDYLTDDDYPFNYNVCITNEHHNFFDLTDNKLHYTFSGLQSLTNYSISIQARSGDMSGPQAKLNVTTFGPGKYTPSIWRTDAGLAPESKTPPRRLYRVEISTVRKILHARSGTILEILTKFPY